MLGLVKMSALSAVLSFGVVQAYDHATSPVGQEPSGKAFHDRILPGVGTAARAESPVAVLPVRGVADGQKGDRLAVVAPNCTDQEWPYLSADCLARDDGHQKPGRVRVITIERREGVGVSVLERTPVTAVANR